MEKELYASNAKFKWFEYKLGETERHMSEANLRTLSLKEKVRDLDAEVELQKKAIVRAEDDVTNRGIDAGFKIFKWLLLEV